MATFTMELRTLNELFPDWIGRYPLFDESYREHLNNTILDHYYFREIGYETPEMFIRQFNMLMRRKMPYFNAYYKTTLIEYDPLVTYLMETTGKNVSASDIARLGYMDSEGSDTLETAIEALSEGKTASDDIGRRHTDTKAASTTDTKQRTVSSEFPQVQLSGDGDYASSAVDSIGHTGSGSDGSEQLEEAKTSTSNSQNKDSSKQSNSSASKGSQSTSDSEKAKIDELRNSITKGFGASPSTALKEFRNAIINVDEMILAALSNQFMNLYDIHAGYSDQTSTWRSMYTRSFFYN